MLDDATRYRKKKMTEQQKESKTKMLYTTPALPVKDMGRSVEFYRDKLGFSVLHHEAGYAVLRRDEAGIHLWLASDEDWRTRSGGSTPVVSGAESFIAGTASCRVAVENVEELHAALQPLGILHPIESHADTALYFGCPDVDAAYEHLRAKGIEARPTSIAPYGMKQLYVNDPDGYNLCFQWPSEDSEEHRQD
jgi:catechol 2,3-dioxygenase-like lactoylglutathione lyase family enzyme